MSEKIYKIEIENKLTTLFVAHAEGGRAGAAEQREECLDIIKDGPHDCTAHRQAVKRERGVAAAGCCLVLMAKRNCQDERRAKLAIDKKTLPEGGGGKERG